MARAGAAAALVLSVGLRALAQEPVQDFGDSVEREFALRRWAQAADGEARAEALALGRDGRVTLLRALERAREFGLLASNESVASFEPVARMPGEVAPDLLVAALRLGLVTQPDAVLAAAQHPLPAVRLALLQSATASLRDIDALERLAHDADERVASAALEYVVELQGESVDVRELATRVLRGGDPRVWRGLAARLQRARPSRVWLAVLEDSASDVERAAIVSALRVRFELHDASAERAVERVAAAWPGPIGFEELFTDAARAVRSSEHALGRALLERLRAGVDDSRDHALVRGSFEAWPAADVLDVLRSEPRLRERVADFLFEELAPHATELAPADLEPWLDASVAPELRRAAVGLARELVVEEARAEFGALLVRALDDGARSVGDEAFSALCAARPVEPWIEALARRWRSVEASRAEALLAELPRGVRLEALRADLCRIASQGGAAGMSAFDLLAPFAPDTGIAALARERLAAELADLERQDARATELRAAALVRVVHEQAGTAGHEELARVLARTLDRVEVSKAVIWALGQDALGRERLVRWLEDGVPRRLRIEAALSRAPFGDARAVEVLGQTWASCDFDLRARALRACDANAAEPALALLRRVALDSAEHGLHRELALDLLARRRPPDVDTLLGAATARDLDLRRHALAALGGCGDARARAWLRERLELREEASETLAGRAVRELEREAIWTALAEAHALDSKLVEQWLSAPLAAAAEQLRARFRARAQGGSEFSWRSELAVGEELARCGGLSAALERSGAWWTADARLLAAIGERTAMRGDFASARRLLAAAGIGLLGEAQSEERDLRIFEVRCALLGVCEALGALSEHASLVRRLARDERLGRGPHRAFERSFGAFDPARGSDGLARLEASAPLLRARVLAAGGDREAARGALAEASELAGRSGAALAACAEMAALLADR
ncbi:MAG: hypothetical protein FJ298_04255 [Planctomycetes bacterium]|nr:hypothetical protein [Planctomycetota bacterium]